MEAAEVRGGEGESKSTARHESVMLLETLQYLQIVPTDIVVDGTLGGAGHFTAILKKLGRQGALIGIDADGDAIARAERARQTLHSEVPVMLAHDNFRNLEAILKSAKVEKISKALFDLGWSSFHLESGRGFSFRTSEPLFMTYADPNAKGFKGETAADLVNSAPEETLADIFFTYGEERFARPIARAIVNTRKVTPILTADVLAEVIAEATPSWYQHRRLHPATKSFQALRIAVNDELGALREGLGAAMHHLSARGRIAVITFHSIEDRIVKTMFRDAVREGRGTLVTKKPVVPSRGEMLKNPRARSAKLRIFEGSGIVPEELESITNLSYSYL